MRLRALLPLAAAAVGPLLQGASGLTTVTGRSGTVACPANDDCKIECLAKQRCKEMRVNPMPDIASGYQLHIVCRGEQACEQMRTVDCGQARPPGGCSIECDGDQACKELDLDCPNNGGAQCQVRCMSSDACESGKCSPTSCQSSSSNWSPPQYTQKGPPSRAPTQPPTQFPSDAPTAPPTAGPLQPTAGPTAPPERSPTAGPLQPSVGPSQAPVPSPTAPPAPPSAPPSQPPQAGPTAAPAPPTSGPSSPPTAQPLDPSAPPSAAPVAGPTSAPAPPTSGPSSPPVQAPTASPLAPSRPPSDSPVGGPTTSPAPPSSGPTPSPSQPPTAPPQTPSATPSGSPVGGPTASPAPPSAAPSAPPAPAPTQPPLGPSAPPSQPPVGGPTSSPAPPSAAPSLPPVVRPSSAPSAPPSRPPVAGPTVSPALPSLAPLGPSASPVQAPTGAPVDPPTKAPLPPSSPTQSPAVPTVPPTASPSTDPSGAPSGGPTAAPTRSPLGPTGSPIFPPTRPPSLAPSTAPQAGPSLPPSVSPSQGPTRGPLAPTQPPAHPSAGPSQSPRTAAPSAAPSPGPSRAPSASPLGPTGPPTRPPTRAPSEGPSAGPSAQPTAAPSGLPSAVPTPGPSPGPSAAPSGLPSMGPTVQPSGLPSGAPSGLPSGPPTWAPLAPSATPTLRPTWGPRQPTAAPSWSPWIPPTNGPSVPPSSRPSFGPRRPSAQPSAAPTNTSHSEAPTVSPTWAPLQLPTRAPSGSTTAPNAPPTGSPLPPPTRPPSDRRAPPPSVSPRSAAPSASPTAAPTPGGAGLSKSEKETAQAVTGPIGAAPAAVGVAAGLAAAGSAGKLAVVAGMSCQVEDVDVSGVEPLDWEFHPLGFAMGDHSHKFFLGAVLGNALLFFGFQLVHFAAVQLFMWFNKETLVHSMGVFKFPGVSYIFLLFLMQGTSLSAANMLFKRSGAPAATAVVGAVVLLMCFAVPPLLYFKLLRPRALRAELASDDRVERLHGCKRQAYVFVFGMQVWVTKPNSVSVKQWFRVTRPDEDEFAEQWDIVFGPYKEKYVWYPCLELVIVLLISLISAWEASLGPACHVRNVMLCLLFFIPLAFAIWRRPCISVLENGLIILFSLLVFFAVFFLALSITVSGSHAAGQVLSDIAMDLLLISSLCMMLKAIYDIVQAVVDIWSSRRKEVRDRIRKRGAERSLLMSIPGEGASEMADAGDTARAVPDLVECERPAAAVRTGLSPGIGGAAHREASGARLRRPSPRRLSRPGLTAEERVPSPSASGFAELSALLERDAVFSEPSASLGAAPGAITSPSQGGLQGSSVGSGNLEGALAPTRRRHQGPASLSPGHSGRAARAGRRIPSLRIEEPETQDDMPRSRTGMVVQGSLNSPPTRKRSFNSRLMRTYGGDPQLGPVKPAPRTPRGGGRQQRGLV
eukprot:TRINITY_DN13469_c0_g1_i2.p1 TRINITY_DN13469_c0_g1~~TRINITY_DN13469_c0_g1_i2.p1  ORF type:complete len:1419 (+),score=192.84 TRINITY_DN13469_c0_g1_i2:73-4329(+)